MKRPTTQNQNKNTCSALIVKATACKRTAATSSKNLLENSRELANRRKTSIENNDNAIAA
jgi:hypothetical protein